MALLDIREYGELACTQKGAQVMVGMEQAVAKQQLSVSASSVQSATFSDVTRFVRLHSDVACRIEFGASPTANATSSRLAPGSSEFFGVQPGTKIAVIQSST